jgi:hypothetical protein
MGIKIDPKNSQKNKKEKGKNENKGIIAELRDFFKIPLYF